MELMHLNLLGGGFRLTLPITLSYDETLVFPSWAYL